MINTKDLRGHLRFFARLLLGQPVPCPDACVLDPFHWRVGWRGSRRVNGCGGLSREFPDNGEVNIDSGRSELCLRQGYAVLLNQGFRERGRPGWAWHQ
jgi:hypothetical protein